MKILVFEDDDIVGEFLKTIIEGAGHEVVLSPDGHNSIELARAERPDVIVLDIGLPGKTGIEVLPGLRDDPVTQAIPVVTVSAHNKAEVRDSFYAAGGDRFITKPVDSDRLLATISEVADAACRA